MKTTPVRPLFCFDNASPEKSCLVIDLVCSTDFAMPTSCSVSECHQKRVKTITPFASKGKVDSCNPLRRRN